MGGTDGGGKEQEEEEWISLLIGEMVLELTDMAGAMSFRPKLSRLLETLFMLRGGGFVLELELQVKESRISKCSLASELIAKTATKQCFNKPR